MRTSKLFFVVTTTILIVAILAGGLPAPLHAQDPVPSATPEGITSEDATPEEVAAPLAEDAPLDLDPLPDLSPWIKTVRLSTVQDAYIASGQPDSNHGPRPYMNMGYQAVEQAMRPVIQFDLGGIPSKARIQSAAMHLYQFQVLPAGDPATRVDGRMMVAPWSEGGITWHNARYDGTTTNLGNVASSIGWQQLNMQGIVQKWVNGQGNYGVLLTGNENVGQHLRSIRTREAGGGTAPYIDVQYICDTKSPASNVTHPLPQYSKATFTVQWSGEDKAPSNCTPSGMQYFELEYSVNNSGTWHRFNKGKYPPQQMADAFTHTQDGDTVHFRWRGVDNVGNKENYGHAQTSTVVDSVPPVTTMTPLPPFMTATSFTIQWAGTDAVSGVADYDVEYRMLMPGASPEWVRLLSSVTETSHLFTGAIDGAIYEFRTRARDHAGNQGHFSDTPQASTTVDLKPHAIVSPFNPPILKPTAPITDSFTVHWTGYAVDGATINEYRIFYNYNNAGWVEFENGFPGTQTSVVFLYLSLGMGDGIYQFEATATDSQGNTKPRTDTAEATMIVDLADAIQPQQYLPIVHRQ